MNCVPVNAGALLVPAGVIAEMVPLGVNCVPVNAGALLVPAGVICEMVPLAVPLATVLTATPVTTSTAVSVVVAVPSAPVYTVAVVIAP